LVYRRVKKRIPTIALDTVYRNLKFLSDRGLITIMGLSKEHLRVDANLKPHHHFVCVKCGAILDFYSDDISELTTPREAQACGQPLSVQLEVKGICGRCHAQAKE
jgi:Fur family transcriptional regulator, peroxide stress response regulator